MHLWDKTIQQVELTLNLLCGSRLNHKISAWEQIHGSCDFKFPSDIAPWYEGTDKLQTSTTTNLVHHAYEAWCVGPALEQDRCYTVWATATKQTRFVNQLKWLPPQPFPQVMSQDLYRATMEDFINLLSKPLTDTFVGTVPSGTS
jgi:hypothetical protein